jgi:hypothetical protein
VSTDGEVFDSFETAAPDRSAGDTVIAAGNVHYRLVSVWQQQREALPKHAG